MAFTRTIVPDGRLALVQSQWIATVVPPAQPPPTMLMVARSGSVTRPALYVSRSTCRRLFAAKPVALTTQSDEAPTAALLASVLCTTEKSCRPEGFAASASTMPLVEQSFVHRFTCVPTSLKTVVSGWTTSPEEWFDASAGVMVSVVPEAALTVNGPSLPTATESLAWKKVLADVTDSVVEADKALAERADCARRISSPCLCAEDSADTVTGVPVPQEPEKLLAVTCS